MPTVELNFTGPQSRAYELIQPDTTTTLMWGRGTGKSFFMRQLMWLLIAEHRWRPREGAGVPFNGIRIAWVMPTLKSFRDVHARLLEAENDGPWAWLGGKLNRGTLGIDFPDGSWVQPTPALEHTSRGGRGLRVDVALGDEIDDVDPPVWDAVVEPWFTEPWSKRIRIVGGTPRRGRHGLLYSMFRLGKDQHPGFGSVHATYLDSPETVDARAAEKAKARTPKSVFAREWMADPDSAEGLVYAFDENHHIKIPPDGTVFNRFVVGVDHGWEHPGAFILVGVTGYGEDAKAWVLEEAYHSGKPNQEWNQLATEWSERYHHPEFFCDPSRPDRIHDLRAAGASVKDADNSVQAGIARVADRLAVIPDEYGGESAHLYVHPKCINIIREFKAYKRKPDPLAADRYLDDIVKRNDDALDALRYSLMGVFGARTGYSTRYEAPGA